jgi:hypothetical protein
LGRRVRTPDKSRLAPLMTALLTRIDATSDAAIQELCRRRCHYWVLGRKDAVGRPVSGRVTSRL